MSVAASIAGLDWTAIGGDLDDDGYATLPRLLDAAQCAELARLYDDDARFRSTISMARYNFGQGEYRYFDYPLPPVVQSLRESLYPHVAVIANRWAERMKLDTRWAADLDSFLAGCHAAGQERPTPLLLRYGKGDYNCLHQDIYGDVWFPLQVIFMLSEPGRDFDGGEIVFVEQRPRMQSRPMVVRLEQGAAAIVAVREKPRLGTRGYYRTQLRHGVSRVTRGRRMTLGIIFHDAR